MPRVDIELTSSRPDGSWTWRASGARQPKGSLDGGVLPAGVAVGDRLRADVEFDVEGPRVVSTTSLKAKREESPRLAIVGSGREEPAITTNVRGGLTGAEDKRSNRRDRDGDRDRRPSGARPSGSRPSGARPGGDRQRPPPGPDRAARADRSGRPDRADRPDRSGGTGGPGRTDGRRRADASERPARAPRSRIRDGATRDSGAPRPPRPPAKRLQPGRVHRDAVLADLGPELRPVAEKVLRGGIAAVRQALEEQNAAARAAGGPEVKADALLEAAEGLVPRLRVAEWRDRAEAALASVDEISVRDLRSVVAGSDAARDDDTRTLAAELREALARRSAADTKAWLDDMTASLADGRIVRALRLSGRPPEPGSRMPPEMASQLAQAAGAALSPTSSPDRWTAVLEAVLASPVRRSVEPAGLPAEADEAFKKSVTDAATRLPALAAMLGLAAPTPRSSPGANRTPGRPVPPPPPRRPAKPPAAPSVTAPDTAATPSGEAASLGDDPDDTVLVQELGEAVDQG